MAGTASYLGGPAAAAMIANKLGENFEKQVAPQAARAGVSETLTRPLRCSLALASCRKYAALRERIAHKATLKLEEPEREKARSPKKKKSAKKSKKRSSKREYSRNREYRGEAREYREARYSSGGGGSGDDGRRWREFRSSTYQ